MKSPEQIASDITSGLPCDCGGNYECGCADTVRDLIVDAIEAERKKPLPQEPTRRRMRHE